MCKIKLQTYSQFVFAANQYFLRMVQRQQLDIFSLKRLKRKCDFLRLFIFRHNNAKTITQIFCNIEIGIFLKMSICDL